MLIAEKEKANLQKEIDVMHRENTNVHKELEKMTKVRDEVLQDYRESRDEIDQLNEQLDSVNKQNNDLENKYLLELQNTHGYKEGFLELVKTLQRHNYEGCECQLKFIPAVSKALNQPQSFKIGPRAEGAVDKLRR